MRPCLVYSAFVLLFLWFNSVQYVHAQKQVTIKGVVTDDKGVPMELVQVRVEGRGAGTLTDLEGCYSLTCQNKDSLVLVFSQIGYRVKKRVLHNLSDSARINMQMIPLDIQLGEAYVRGTGVQSGSMQKLSVKQNKLAPSTTGNAVEELITTQAGVSTHNELSSQYNVRGGSFDENSVYLNGIEIYRPLLIRSGQQEGLSIINSDMVEDIRFSAGGFEAKYGDKMSSVLDITYKKPKKFEAAASASFLGSNAYVGYGNAQFSIMSSIRYKTTQYLLGSMDTKGEYSPRFLDYQAYASWRPNDRWTVDLIGNISDNHYQFVPSNRETSFGTLEDMKSFVVYFDGQEKDYFRTYFGALGLTRHFGKTSDLGLLFSAYSTREQETYDIQGQYWLNEATTQEQLGVGTYREHARNYLTADVMNLQLRFNKKWRGHHLQAALNWKNERVKENSTEWEMRDSSGYSIPHYPDKLQLIYSLRSVNKMSSNRLEAYVQNTQRINTGLGLFTLNYGLRLSYWDWNKEYLLSPRISVGLIPTFNDRLTFRFASGVYYQAPFYKELRDTMTINHNTTVCLNQDIKSQRSIHFVLGGDYQFRLGNRPFKFTAEAYYKALDNLIPYSVNNVRVVYYGRNMSKGYAAGLDFKLFGEFVPGTDSWITFSLMSTQEKLNGKWLPRPTDQRYNLSLFFTDYFPGTDRWLLTLKAAFADGLPFGPPHAGRERQNFRAPAYKRVDMGLSYRLLNNEEHVYRRGFARYVRNIWLGIDAFNVFDINNVNSYYWVTDVTNQQFAVPNYLTGRQLNVRFLIDF